MDQRVRNSPVGSAAEARQGRPADRRAAHRRRPRDLQIASSVSLPADRLPCRDLRALAPLSTGAAGDSLPQAQLLHQSPASAERQRRRQRAPPDLRVGR